MCGLCDRSDWLQVGLLGTLGCLTSWSIFPLCPCKGDRPWACKCAAECVNKDTKESQIRKFDISRSQRTQSKANQIIYTRPHPLIFKLVSHTVYLSVMYATDKGLQVLRAVVINWYCYEIAHNQFPMYYGFMVVTNETVLSFSDTCSRFEPLCHMEGDSCQL